MSVTGERTREESRRVGRALRKQVPRSSHAEWAPSTDRPDPVALLEAQNVDRLQWLVPVRFARMSPSPFTFFRGGAKIMSEDLSTTPDTGLTVQVCGDAHLLNFGTFGSPERALLFDLNDFDETLPGPWEWDVKRFAASLMIASRDNEFDEEEGREATRRGVQAYREAMGGFMDMRAIDVWYSRLTGSDIRQLMPRKPPQDHGQADCQGTLEEQLCRHCRSWRSRMVTGTGSRATRRCCIPAGTWGTLPHSTSWTACSLMPSSGTQRRCATIASCWSIATGSSTGRSRSSGSAAPAPAA